MSEQDESFEDLLTDLEKRMNAIEISMTFQESVVDFVAKAGYDKIYGARPLKRTIQSKIEDALSEKILDGSIKNGDTVICVFEEEEFKFNN
mgnify:CR=1 FL=1